MMLFGNGGLFGKWAFSMAAASWLGVGCGGRITTLGEDGNGDAQAQPPSFGRPDGSAPMRHVPEGGAADVGHDVVSAVEAGFDVLPPPTGLVTIPLSGCVPVYTADIDVGGSGKFQLILDTGSTTLGVASNSCSGCGVSPVYTPEPPAVDQDQMVTSPYVSGSWSGDVYQDTISAGTPTADTAMNFVAIDSQDTFFQPYQCGSSAASYQGIIGFAPAASAVMGTSGFLDSLVADGFTPNLFAFELCDTGGTLWLGGYDPSSVTGPPEYVPMASNVLSKFYYVVTLSQISVNGAVVPIATGSYPDSLLDTGSSIFSLQTDAFNTVTAAITSSTAFQNSISADPNWFANPNNCVSAASTEAELDAMLPPLTFTYGTGESTVTIQAAASDSYIYSYGGQWCPSLTAVDSSEDFPFAADIGSPALKATVTIIDRANSRVGFAPHAACP